jgi:hypothetical protein
MSTARTSLEDQPPATQVTRQHPRTSKLFDREHAYAARLVQIATGTRSIMPSTMAMNAPDQVSSEVQEDNEIAAGIARQPTAHGSPS